MALIGNLLVKLGLNSAVFNRNIKKSRTHLTGFEKGVKGVGRTLARLAGPLAAAFAGYKLAQYVSSTAMAIDRTSKLSDQIGISVEALSSYSLAAELSGTSVEAVGKSLQMLSRRLGESKLGVGEALRGLKLLNLTVEDLTNIPIDQAFNRIADGIHGLAKAEDRAIAIYSLFGRQGQELLPMLQGGAGALREMRKEARELGVVFGRFAADQVVKAVDAITRLKTGLRGLMTQATIRIAPVLEKIAMWLTEWMKGIDFNTLFERIVRGVDWLVQRVLVMLVQFTAGLGALFDQFSQSKIAGWFFGPAGAIQFENAFEGLEALSTMIDKMRQGWITAREEYAAFEARLKAGEGVKRATSGVMDLLARLAGLRAQEAALAGGGTMRAGGPRFAREIESERFNLAALQLGGGDTIPQMQLEEQRKIRAAIESLETALESSVGFRE